LLVGCLVRSSVDYARHGCLSTSPTFTKFGTDVQHAKMSPLTFEMSRSKFKVKTAILKIFQL